MLARLDLHHAPESQHAAVAPSADGSAYTKILRAAGAPTITLPLGARRTLPVGALVSEPAAKLHTSPADLTSGDLALHLIETAERVSFLPEPDH
ncbi:hypothetical protein SAMN05444920_1011136 [Nonomuraea solani]|uniref:Uncharacterized protein n=1 Tax=Nonomuraea solani TaxID=1144553 RepID=A0A1H5WBJ9_9ACTN|nr:hypothetical protein [Nonomuraea solani]SEF96959.1 hypothetical protein SAMN05444920_1011136 [Nonomuraea solani]